MFLQPLIEDKLTSAFQLVYLNVINESVFHQSLARDENFFKAVLVSNDFSGLRVRTRHRLVRAVLMSELAEHVEGLALHTYTESEWEEYYIDQRSLTPTVLAGCRSY